MYFLDLLYYEMVPIPQSKGFPNQGSHDNSWFVYADHDTELSGKFVS